jgi:uncharacterized protein involved in type VI secretion and phage assembly
VTAIEMLSDMMPAPSADDRFFGVAVGIVTNNKDPDKLGRVKLRFPWLSDADESNWARVMAPMAGKDRGFYALPEVNDEVLVVFEHGRVDHPYVLGALWNGKDTPPEDNSDGKNNRRSWKSRSGHTITFDDTDGAEKIVILDKTGKNMIEFDSKQNTVAIESGKDLNITAKGKINISAGSNLTIECNKFALEANTYEIKGTNAKLEATGGMAIKCMAGVKINDGALEVT